jgi:hypothetical protein
MCRVAIDCDLRRANKCRDISEQISGQLGTVGTKNSGRSGHTPLEGVSRPTGPIVPERIGDQTDNAPQQWAVTHYTERIYGYGGGGGVEIFHQIGMVATASTGFPPIVAGNIWPPASSKACRQAPSSRGNPLDSASVTDVIFPLALTATLTAHLPSSCSWRDSSG